MDGRDKDDIITGIFVMLVCLLGTITVVSLAIAIFL